jgi:GNAT superfamily N-acetyltransferase
MAAGDLDIRLARPDEYDELGRLLLRSYATIPGLDADPEHMTKLADVAGRARDTETLTAIVEGRLAGVATYVPGPDTSMSEFNDPDAAGIRALAVDPDHHRRGIGRALTVACVDLARSAGKHRVILHTSQYQQAAHAMYQRMGFRRERALDWDPTPTISLTCYVYEIDRS